MNKEILLQILTLLENNCSIMDCDSLKTLIYCLYCNKNYLKNSDEEINVILDSIIDKLFIEMEIQNHIIQENAVKSHRNYNHLIASHLKNMVFED